MTKHQRVLEKAVTAVVLTAVTAFIIVDLLDALSWPSWPFSSNDSVIEHYVKFTQVEVGNFRVDTGQRFTSSFNRQIERQWCYAIPNDIAPGAVSSSIELGEAEGEDLPSYHTLTDDALVRLSLTRAEAEDFAVTHCRFKQ